MSQINSNPDRLPIPKPEPRGKKPPKHIRQAGKVAQSWAKKKAQWFKDNPPNFQGFYTCGICGGSVHESQVDLDHIINRSLRPDLREADENLQPCHHQCNVNKKLGGARK